MQSIRKCCYQIALLSNSKRKRYIQKCRPTLKSLEDSFVAKLFLEECKNVLSSHVRRVTLCNYATLCSKHHFFVITSHYNYLNIIHLVLCQHYHDSKSTYTVISLSKKTPQKTVVIDTVCVNQLQSNHTSITGITW